MDRQRRRLLITGASGFLGWHLARLASPHHEVLVTSRRRPRKLPGAVWIEADLREPEAVERLLGAARPDWVVHLAAAADTGRCEQDPAGARRINVEATATLARLAAARGARCLVTSTDQVFDGTRPPYAEGDPVAPVNVYGRQKADAEQELARWHPEPVVARLPLLFGPPAPGAPGSLARLVAALREGRSVQLFTDEFRSPVSAADAARGLLLLVDTGRDLSGGPAVVHLGGAERVSRHELGCRVVALLGLPEDRVVAARRAEVKLPAPRPADVTLRSERARSLGFAPRPVAESLEEAVRAILQASGPAGGRVPGEPGQPGEAGPGR